LDRRGQPQSDPVLSMISARQYVDWRDFRHRDVNSTELKQVVERFCGNICRALRRPWLSPEERAAQEAAARQRAGDEEERRCEEYKIERRAQEAHERTEAQTRRQADEDRREHEAGETHRGAQARRVDEQPARRQLADNQTNRPPDKPAELRRTMRGE